MVERPTGTVTFLFSDVEGSTQLLKQLGEAYEDLVRDYRALTRQQLGGSGGHEIDTQGDAFFFSFTRARDAVAGAIALQRALAEHEWPHGADVRVRMGLHTGEPAIGEEGYLGLDVVRAARICSAGHGGQILISEATRGLLGNELPDGAQVRDLGPQRLKDIQEERLFQISVDGRAEQYPALKTEDDWSEAGKSRADLLGERFEQRIEDFVARQLERSLGSESSSPRDLAELERGLQSLEQLKQLQRGRRHSAAGLVVRGLFLVLLVVSSAALVVYVVRALF